MEGDKIEDDIVKDDLVEEDMMDMVKKKEDGSKRSEHI